MATEWECECIYGYETVLVFYKTLVPKYFRNSGSSLLVIYVHLYNLEEHCHTGKVLKYIYTIQLFVCVEACFIVYVWGYLYTVKLTISMLIRVLLKYKAHVVVLL